MSAKYDSIGRTYTRTRRADPRIVAAILELLGPDANSVVEIGAGTGNYSRELAQAGKRVLAIEPSRVMIDQADSHPNLRWMQSTVEDLAPDLEQFDAALCMLSFHHFQDKELAVRNIFRLLKPGGKLLMFSADPRLTPDDCWMKNYFEPLYDLDCENLPALSRLRDLLKEVFQADVSVRKFMLPDDLKDQFFYANWKYPERYLDEEVRRGSSVFSLLPDTHIDQLLGKLEADLTSGAWDRTYGRVRDLSEYDGGYFFVATARN